MAFYPNDMLTSAYLVGAVNERPSKEAIRQGYRGLDLCPWEEVEERQVIWDVMYSENNLASFTDPNGHAVPGDDVLFSSVITTLADVKAARTLDPWASMQLRDAGEVAVYKTGTRAGNSRRAKLAEHINKRLAWCNEAVDSQIEYIIMHALQGSVVWPPVDADGNTISVPMAHWNANMSVNIPFNLPAAQNQAVTTLSGYSSRTGSGIAWSTVATSTPFDDLDIINEYMIKEKGVRMRGGVMLMSEVDLGLLTRNTSVTNYIFGSDKSQTGSRQFANLDEVFDFIKTRYGWTIQTYDSQWTYRTIVPHTKPTISRVPFLGSGKVLIFPAAGIQAGHMMTAPQMTEDRNWVFKKMGWQVQAPKPPYDIEMGVNLVAWPRFDYYDWFCLDVRS